MTQTSTTPVMQSPPTGTPTSEPTRPPSAAQAWADAHNPMNGPLMRPVSDQEIQSAFPDQVRTLTTARERFEGQQARLFREDGERIYAEKEHQTRHDALVAQVDAGVRNVETYLQGVIDRADRDLTLLDADPADSLTPQQLAEANSRRAFVNEDVEAMRFDALASRVRAILEGGSTPLAFLYARAVERKLTALTDARRQGRPPVLLPADEQALRDLHPLLDRLREKVRGGPQDPNRRNDLLRRRTVAQLALSRADRVRAFADGREAQWQKNMADRVRGML